MSENTGEVPPNIPLERPIEPNWTLLEQQKDSIMAKGMTGHKIQGAYYAIKHAFELGEEIVGWDEKTILNFQAALKRFEDLQRK